MITTNPKFASYSLSVLSPTGTFAMQGSSGEVQIIKDAQQGQKFNITSGTRTQLINKPPFEENILKNAVLFDIETLGVQTQTIHEMSLFDLENNKLTVFLPENNLIRDANHDINAFNMVSSSKREKVDVLKQLGDDAKAKLSFKDIAFADFLMNRKAYTELIQETSGKAEFTQFNALLTNLQAIDDNASLDAVNKEKQKAAFLFNDANVSMLRDESLLKNAGFNKAFERDNQYLARYILKGSEAFEKFQKEQPALSKFYSYLSEASGKFNQTDLTELTESYIKSLGTSGKYTADQLKGLNIEIVQGKPMDQLLKDVASRMQDKTVFIANAAFESKQIGAQIQASVEDQLNQKIADKKAELGLTADQELPRKILSAIKEEVYSEHNPFAKVGFAGSVSTGEPFYVSGIEYNAAATQGRMTGNYTGLAKQILQGTGPGETRDILDIFRAEQSMLKKYDITSANRPIALSVEMQGRLHKFTELMMSGASEEELKETLSKFKETHTSSLDVMVHEATALKQSVVQTEALFQYMTRTDRGKDLFKLAKEGKGGLYQAVAYGKILEDLSPKLEKIALQQRVVTNLKQVEEFGYATQAEVTGIKYREQQREIGTPDNRFLLKEKLATPNYERKELMTFEEFKKSILEQEIYDYKGKPQDFVEIEKGLLGGGFLKPLGEGKYEFVDHLTNIEDQSDAAKETRSKFKDYIKAQENKVSESIKSVEEYSESFNLTNFKNSVNKFFGMNNLEDIKPVEIQPGFTKKLTPEQKAAQEVRSTTKALNQHLSEARSHFMFMMKDFYGKPQFSDIEAALDDEHHVVSKLNNTTTPEVRQLFEDYKATGEITVGKTRKQKPKTATEESEIKKTFVKDYLEARYHEETGINQDLNRITPAQQETYIAGQKRILQQAAERELLFGTQNIPEVEKQINEQIIYGKKTVGEYRQDFSTYKQTGQIKTSYGANILDESFSKDLSDADKAKRFSQVVFEAEESARMPLGASGEVLKYTEPEIKNYLINNEVPTSSPKVLAEAPTIIEPTVKPNAVNIEMPTAKQISEIAEPIMKRNLNQGLDQVIKDSFRSPKVMKGLGIYAAGAASLGLLSLAQEDLPKEKSLVSQDYSSWFENQKQYFGSESNFKTAINKKYESTFEGLPEQGFASYLRKINTDFGSPYQGPEISQGVFDNQKLMNERRKYMRQVFADRNFREGGEIHDMLRSFVSFRPKFQRVQQLYSEHEQVDDRTLAGLKGKNLVKLKVSDEYQINIEDADTITLQRKGVPNNSLAAFMGSNSFSFRLAGIDAPETAHEGRASQPHAEESKKLLQNLISKGELDIVVDPENVTYGRQVATLFSKGKNLNLELIREGAVSYLPFKGKGQQQMYDQKAYAAAHKYASEANRGMWAEPYFQVYADMMRRTGQSITFNTLVNAQETAKNSITSNIATTMEQAQQEGEYTQAQKEEMNLIAEDIKDRKGLQKSQPEVFKSLELRKQYEETKNTNPLKDDFSGRFVDGSLNNQKYNSHLDEMSYDLKRLIESKGSKNLNNKMKTTGSKKNNLDLVESGMNAQKSQSITQTNPQMHIDREKRIMRQNVMQAMQHKALLNLKQSPINHHRM